MSNYLKANEYLQNAKYELVPQNVYDTVSGSMTLSSQASQVELTGNISISSSDISSMSWTNRISQKNIGHWGLFHVGQAMAKSIVAVKMKTYTITLTNASQSISSRNCSASIKLKGHQWNATYDDSAYSLSDIDDIEGVDEWTDWSNADNIVKEVKKSFYAKDDWETDSDYVNYSANKVPMFGFLKADVDYLSDVQFTKTVKKSGEITYSPAWGDTVLTEHMPSNENVITKWMPLTADYSSIITYNCYHCSSADWEYSGNKYTGGTLPVNGTTWKERSDLDLTGNNPYDAMITYNPTYEQITFTYKQISDNSIQVIVSIPIAYVYAAASAYTTRTYVGILYKHDCDSTLFYNETTSAEITLTCGVQGTDTQDFSYSLDSSGNLTTSVKNVNIFNLTNNELITDNARVFNTFWDGYISKSILTQYRDGKTTFECKVPSEVGYAKNFQINDLYYIKKQDGSSILRGYKEAPFYLKNITKTLEKGTFYWTLKFLEGAIRERVNQVGYTKTLYSLAKNASTRTVSELVDTKVSLVPYASRKATNWFIERANTTRDNAYYRCAKISSNVLELSFYDVLLYNATLESGYTPLVYMSGVTSVLSYSLTNSDSYGLLKIRVQIDANYVNYFLESNPGFVIIRVTRASPFNRDFVKDVFAETNAYAASLFGICLHAPQLTNVEDNSLSIESADQMLMLKTLNSFNPSKQKLLLKMSIAFKSSITDDMRVLAGTLVSYMDWIYRGQGGNSVVSIKRNRRTRVRQSSNTIMYLEAIFDLNKDDLTAGIVPVYAVLPSDWSIRGYTCYIIKYDSVDLEFPN